MMVCAQLQNGQLESSSAIHISCYIFIVFYYLYTCMVMSLVVVTRLVVT